MKLYLAGPAVFRADAIEIGAALKALCAAHGAQGLFPLDNEVTADSVKAATQIFRGNVAMIREADAIVADITPFRGVHCDVGTAWEIGFAFGLGKPVHAYTARAGDLIARIWCERAEHAWRDWHGDAVEDFGLPDNLMIALSVSAIHASAEAAIAAAVASIESSLARGGGRSRSDREGA